MSLGTPCITIYRSSFELRINQTKIERGMLNIRRTDKIPVTEGEIGRARQDIIKNSDKLETKRKVEKKVKATNPMRGSFCQSR